MNAKEHEKLMRSVKTGRSWSKRSTEILRWSYVEETHPHILEFLAYEAGESLERFLDDADTLAGFCSPDQIEEAERAAMRISKRLRARRLANKLENVEGRTPEEAAAFKARAAGLLGAV